MDLMQSQQKNKIVISQYFNKFQMDKRRLFRVIWNREGSFNREHTEPKIIKGEMGQIGHIKIKNVSMVKKRNIY